MKCLFEHYPFRINKFKLFIKEKVRDKIKNLAENFWEIIKNEGTW